MELGFLPVSDARMATVQLRLHVPTVGPSSYSITIRLYAKASLLIPHTPHAGAFFTSLSSYARAAPAGKRHRRARTTENTILPMVSPSRRLPVADPANVGATRG